MMRLVNQTLTTATILSGQSVTESLNLGGNVPLHVVIPSAWTAAPLTLEVSLEGSNWITAVYDDAGSLMQVSSPVASAAYTFTLLGIYGFKYYRFRSGTSGSPVTQSADRVLSIVSVNIQ